MTNAPRVTEERVCELLQDFVGDFPKLTPTSSLHTAGFDSLDVVELAMILEEEIRCIIPEKIDPASEKFQTPRAIAAYLNTAVLNPDS